jgi:hypothetical protein
MEYNFSTLPCNSILSTRRTTGGRLIGIEKVIKINTKEIRRIALRLPRGTHADLKQSIALKQPQVLTVTGPFFNPGTGTRGASRLETSARKSTPVRIECQVKMTHFPSISEEFIEGLSSIHSPGSVVLDPKYQSSRRFSRSEPAARYVNSRRGSVQPATSPGRNQGRYRKADGCHCRCTTPETSTC